MEVSEDVQQFEIKKTLKEVFGYHQFRGNQEEIINNVLEKKNALVIMPTGAGKSLCYQLPAIVLKGTALIISPLIALMKNQVDLLNAYGINAKVLNSTLSKSEANKVKKEALEGKVKMLYIAPESLAKEENIVFFKKVDPSFVAVDEAHCISEWGHDFRPEYRRIKEIIKELGNLPLIALTATATPKVEIDIIRNLEMEDATIFKSSFNRENLFYEIRPKKGAKKHLIKFVKEREGKSGIVYCWSRKKVEEIAEFLKVNGIKARPYHAGMESKDRVINQDDFLNEDIDVIVATIAFGMGIDKPDIRFVVHYDAPKSLESYYQETGRAGRDGLEGHCLMFYSFNDVMKLEKFNKDKPVSEKENARILLEEVIQFSESSVCRRKILLHYFGERYEKDCGFCDNCSFPKERFTEKEAVVSILKSVQQTNERFGIPHLVNVLRSIPNQYVTSYGHDKLEVFGECSDIEEEVLGPMIRQVLIIGFLEKNIESVGLISITKEGKAYLKKPYEIEFSKNREFPDSDEEVEDIPMRSGKGHDIILFDLLKKERKKQADLLDLPPYVIFQDPQFEEMATTYPSTFDELVMINGIGQGKARKFGKPFLELIVKYVEENDIPTANDVLVKTSGANSKNKIFLISQIDKKVDLEEICETKGWTMETLLVEIENICQSGTKLNLDYYLDEMVDEEKEEEVFEYFMNSDNDSLEDALDELGDEYFTEEEIRLLRVKFLSEVAN
jgi:ATP-dependent DNA helicase RecQ